MRRKVERPHLTGHNQRAHRGEQVEARESDFRGEAKQRWRVQLRHDKRHGEEFLFLRAAIPPKRPPTTAAMMRWIRQVHRRQREEYENSAL